MKYITYLLCFTYSSLFTQTEIEPNNELINANEIQFNTVYSAFINDTGDYDLFKFTISEPTILNIEITDVPLNIDLETFIYHNDFDLVWSDYSKGNGESFNIVLSICNSGTYHIIFRDGSTTSLSGGFNFNVNESYNFKIDTLSLLSNDLNECNNDFDSATEIEICTPISAAINPWFRFNDLINNAIVKDTDYYQVELEAGNEADIVIENIPNDISICLSIYNEGAEEIETIQGINGQNIEFNFMPIEDGIYFIKIEECSNHFSLQNNYRLKVGCKNLISSIADDIALNFKVHPNPFSDFLTIESDETIKEKAQINIYNFTGTKIYSIEHSLGERLSLKNLSKGIYFLKIDIGKNSFQSKIIRN